MNALPLLRSTAAGPFRRGFEKERHLQPLLHDNCLEMINPQSSFQYYDLGGLWQDVERVMSAGLHVANLFTEPVSTHTILQRFFPEKRVGEMPAQENAARLRHAVLWLVGAERAIYCLRR